MSAQANDKLRERLIGSWRLISAMREEIPSGEKTPFLGENPTGFLHYLPDGRMLAMITRAGRKPPAGNVVTAAEAEGLIRSMIAYGSNYECVGDEVLHHCDLSWNEKFTGTVQRRKVRVCSCGQSVRACRHARLSHTTRSPGRHTCS